MASLDPIDTFTGVVQEKLLNRGSKSEHQAVILKTDDGRELKLRLIHGNPFNEPELKPFVGSRVFVKGCTQGDTNQLFIMQTGDIVILGPPGRPARPLRKPRPPGL